MDTNTIINILAFTVLALMWSAFGLALVFNRGLLDRAWSVLRGWPLLIRVMVALLVLPVFLGLWIWQAKWPAWLRLVLVAALAWVTIYTFFPTSL